MFAKIGFINPGIDTRLYTYQIPQFCEDVCHVGKRVNVDFAGKRIWGIVVYVESTTEYDKSKIKAIDSVENDNFTLTLDAVKIAEWMVDAYHCGWGSALKCLLPPGINSKSSSKKTEYKKQVIGIKLSSQSSSPANLSNIARSKGQETILRLLQANDGFMSLEQISDSIESYASPVNSLCKNGVIEKVYTDFYRSPELHEWVEHRQEKKLNNEQQSVLKAIMEADEVDNRPFLLHGVTGAGKTEIYLRLIEECILKQKQAILLVPEIALTTQTVGRVLAKFKAVSLNL